MNEINFEIKDVENMDFSMDIGIKEVLPPLENLEVNPTNEQQVFNHENSYGYDTVTVNPIEGDELIVTPTKEEQSFNGVYDNVKVNAVTSEIDENIIAENIKSNVEILGVKGNFVGGKYAPKYISFRDCPLSDLSDEINQLDTSNITTMSYMFNNCRNLLELDLSNFNTSNVTSMFVMFTGCSALEEVDLSSFDTQLVTDVSSMFADCAKIKRLDLQNFYTPALTAIQRMFYNCTDLEYIDIRNMSMGTLIYSVNYLFYSCTSLQHLDVRSFDFTTARGGTSAFNGVPANCEIIVKDDAVRDWILANSTNGFTNIKTVAELTE